MVVTYYSKPIKTIQYDKFLIDYVNWDKGFRLLEVNKKSHQAMTNWEFNFFMNVLLKLKTEGKI